ncbi:MAG: DUF5686 family protein [Cryomorphaceae bacterium]
MKLLIAVFALAISAGSAFAQKTVITGSVKDAQTGEPLPFVNVAFKNSKVGTTSDIDGNFSIDTYYATDSLMASFMGYKPQAKKVNMDVSQEIHFKLEEGSVNLGEVVISGKDAENPAHVILRSIIQNKPINNRAKLDAYEYETYNKIQFDLNNLSEKFTKRRVFKDFDFIFDNIDSTSEKVSLPFFLTESLSDYYYRRKPRDRKEVIKGTHVSGINNESISQFLGEMYQDVNIYENSINIFGKNFTSPISSYALLFYKFYLVDSAFIDTKWCYKLDFLPRNENELVFEGHMWVNDTTYAVKEIDARILKSANINFVTDLQVKHEYDEVEREVWMLTKEKLIADFALVNNETGFYGRKLTSYRNFVINEPRPDEFYSGAEFVTVQDSANDRSKDFWKGSRHEVISTNEQAIYDMVDSLKTNPRFTTYIDIVNFLIQGYKQVGPVEIGPMFTFISFNQVEGLRPKFGLRTSSDFSKDMILEGHVAYGFRDEEWKYRLGGRYMLNRNPRTIVGAFYSEELELVGQVPVFFPRDHWVQFFTVRNPQDRLMFNKELRAFIEREWFTGFSTTLEVKRQVLEPRGAWDFEQQTQFDPVADALVTIPSITATEVSVAARFAYRENFVSGDFERISLGSKYPIVSAKFDLGVAGPFGGQYDYNRLTVNVSDKIRLGPFGNIAMELEAGKTWGDIPYPLQFIHAGDETIFYNSKAFNTMNFFEFVSDQYASLRTEYHMDGLFLNKIPLFKKLKWREVVGLNAIYGTLDLDNSNEFVLPARTFSLEEKPFAEAYVGIENIFRFVRIDAMWRLSYRDKINARNFGLFIGFNIQF